ncbi:histidinol dehydrogenase [Pseudoflavonifractor sp. 60]|uniref:histidinol dehydrogenase n=1 Tax=Pseudoflavonifractor sp. 60 TaxID=2304576 RepID=UPI001371B8DA|nr:histidinol dehydrogenase [Pseudoflavonifractor sp. 60]
MIQIYNCGEVPLEDILNRREELPDVSQAVADIIAAVRREGDAALFRFARELDQARLEELEVGPAQLDRALEALEPELRAILEEAADHIRSFHRYQVRSSFVITDQEGVVLGQKVTPLDRVGLYIPGGTAAYPSTVLMNAIPAKIAGCSEVVMVSPPTCNGDVNPTILAAAKIAGVDRVFRCGGAQAVAALAYGTGSISRVDKIVGPGNAFVAEAKRQVFGQVAIDMLAGPSEILVIADGASDAAQVAADLLSQAEHDKNASAVLITDSADLARDVSQELERQLSSLPRQEIARASIDHNGKIIIAENILQGIEIANTLAPEHLELCVDNPFDYLDKVRHAGSIFLGRSCPEALGDYFAGPNHTLPTSGTARFSSPLSVDDFVKKSQFTYYTPAALNRAAGKIARFARAEGLEGHARSALSRQEERERLWATRKIVSGRDEVSGIRYKVIQVAKTGSYELWSASPQGERHLMFRGTETEVRAEYEKYVPAAKEERP